jgi:tRNA(Ile)-lysidine synthase
MIEWSAEFKIKKDSSFAYVDADMLEFPLTLRKWVPGDIFSPFGMKGKRKKISDLLIDMKIDMFKKEEVFVLVNRNEDIIWVVGLRNDERFRIMESTKRILEISIMKKN